MAYPSRHVIFRLPPQVTLTPVNFAVQVITLVLRKLKGVVAVTQLRFQQMPAAVIQVLQRATIRQGGFQQVPQRVVIVFMPTSAVLFGGQQPATVVFQRNLVLRLGDAFCCFGPLSGCCFLLI
ncbi:hypothetical protein VNX24_12915 [Citrobacter farmeri]|uniref:hypothetical protein n=1 Tax=Citrobacter farmeri TaxID=67824 RepID=UPI0023B09B0F|nr:hypothetical protein [Citrobacter farmeri]MEC3929596.1 hypothetical protein [Citrobacter farmeri]